MSRGAVARPEAAPSARLPLPRRQLPPPRRMTGDECRWIDPESGALKLVERAVDRFASRHVYPHLLGIWSPYSWQLPRRLVVAEASVRLARRPPGFEPLTVLLVTDVHAGPFLLPAVLADVLADLMALEPDLVVLGGDLVTGGADDLHDDVLDALAVLSRAPLGAWFAYGNHEYFGPAPERVAERLASREIGTLRNASVRLRAAGGLVLGGLDDLVLGAPDWDALAAAHGAPHVLLSHNPDAFYEAAARGVPLVLSGHTHGGQIRLASAPPLVRQSRYCLDEGRYAYGDSELVVSCGLGASGLPWRVGARPEAVLLTVR